MSTISSVSGSSDAWAAMKAQRSQMQAKMFAKADSNSSGGVDKTELQSMLTDMASKTGTPAVTISDQQFTKMDANSDGSLSSDELGKGMKAISPPPSTMDFAQTRTASTSGKDDLFSKIDSNGDGSVSKTELQSLVDKMASDSNSTGTTSTSAASSSASTSSSDMFAKLDANNDGSLSKSEFDAGRPENQSTTQSTTDTQGAGKAPPPHAGGAGGAGGAAPSTTYDVLDTNEDGTVSLAERLAGTTKNDPTATLMKAIDTNGDSKISASESDSFIQQLSTQLASSAQSSQTTDASSAGTTAKKDSINLAELVKQAYEQIASGLSQQSKGSTISALA